uniref:Uncharacterized protein n=1 Tax=Streptomyces phage Scarif TaxID=3158858 RepID=A0AAU7GXL5_9CAUD
MATKKQKREAALAKREKFLKEERERGLAALQADRERRDKEVLEMKQKARSINDHYRAILAQHGIND